MHLSDLHFGAEIPAAVDGLIHVADELQPDHILIGGDFTMRARRAEWQAARRFLDRLPVPSLSIPGNHDIPGANHLWQRFFNPFERYRQAIAEDLEPTAVIGDIEVVGLNTARRFGAPSFDWSRGAVSVAQCVGLPFRFREETPLRAVLVHHPLTASAKARRRLLSRNGMLLAALEAAKVDLVLAGHFHQAYTAVLPLPLGEEDIVLANAATACSWRVKGEPPGFHLIVLEEGWMEIENHQFDEASGRFRKHGSVHYSKIGKRWSPVTDRPSQAPS